MENKKTNTVLKVALGIVIALFLITGFYTLNLYNEKKETTQQLLEEKQLVIQDLDTMAKQYDQVIQENEVANTDLVDARTRIEALKDSLKISEANIKSLWQYKQRYRSLQKEMHRLLAQNDSLRSQNSQLANSLRNSRLELQTRTAFSDSLINQNSALAKVVQNAAVLSTVGLRGFGVIERKSGKLIPTDRARRVDKIRVCFTVAKNPLVESGDQELYVQVIAPNNRILGRNEQIQFDDKIFSYSALSRFNYENANLDVCEFIAKTDGKFEKGRYIVNIFNEKNVVANTAFTLK